MAQPSNDSTASKTLTEIGFGALTVEQCFAQRNEGNHFRSGVSFTAAKLFDDGRTASSQHALPLNSRDPVFPGFGGLQQRPANGAHPSSITCCRYPTAWRARGREGLLPQERYLRRPIEQHIEVRFDTGAQSAGDASSS